MSDDPAHPADHEQRIRENAYYLWEHEGSPEGRDEEFWERARLRVAAQDEPVAEHLATPAEDPADVALHDSFPASDPPASTPTKGPALD